MLTLQIVRNSIEEISSITKVNLAVFDVDGNLISKAGNIGNIDRKIITEFVSSSAESQVVENNHLLKVTEGSEPVYVVLACGTSDAYTIGRLAASQLSMLNAAYKEKYDKNNFMQSLLMDNMLLVDMYNRAKKLHIEVNEPRLVYIVECGQDKDGIVTELLRGMFTAQSGDFVTVVDEDSVIVVKSLKDSNSSEYIFDIANSIVDTVSAEAMQNVRVGFGTVVNELKDVSRSYKEAMISIDVGKIFNAQRKVNAYAGLGIGRLIYQLPANLCQMFIKEIFKENDPSTFDEEIVSTVYKFFENNLNVSETSRQMFIHRNTLVYRVEKLKNLTGLDVRVFDDALTFMIGMMVYNYLCYLESKE